jgi:hypothetical protein
MQMLQSEEDFCCIQASAIFRKSLFAADVKEELTTFDVFHHKVEAILMLNGSDGCLERIKEPDQVWMGHALQNAIFRQDMLEGFVVNEARLFDDFDSVILPRRLLRLECGQHDFAVVSFAQNFDEIEMVWSHF